MEKCVLFMCFVPLMLVCLLLPSSSTEGQSISTDESALIAMKAQLTSDLSGALENWTASVAVCDWIGVTCGSLHHRVTELNISNMGLAGEVPREFGNLSFLVSLDMSNNQFTGTIPREFSHLRRMRSIWLGSNSFTGEVPSSFTLLPELQLLSLDHNNFNSLNGFFDAFSFNKSRLESLDLSFNNLQGSIPESIGNLRNLRGLSLEGNQLSGFIPSSICNLSTLEILYLSRNPIQGLIPQNIGNCYNLRQLYMEFNQLNGSIPFEVFNISTLQVLAFSSNRLSGTLPDDICLRLPLLRGLYLSSNTIDGRIPSNFSGCPELVVLSLSTNNFFGNISTDIWNLERLDTLYLHSNKLTGTIPLEIGKHGNIRLLGMQKNMLIGAIPSTLFNLSSLQQLLLADNQLDGYLSEDFANLTALIEFDLGGNNFTGVIPQVFAKLTELQELVLGQNSLHGSVPPDIFNISGLKTIALAVNNLSGNLPSNIGYLLPNLENLFLADNNFHGVLPNSIINCSQLTILDLSKNSFMGRIPSSIGELRLLRLLGLEGCNFISESDSTELTFISSLVNCRNLEEVYLSLNPHLIGVLPVSLGNLSSSLNSIYAVGCEIKGHIPNEVGNLTGLVRLDLERNNLDGPIPTTLNSLHNLQILSLGGNRIKGLIPNNLCGVTNMGALRLHQNQLIGSIPECLGNASSLREIDLGSNNLTSGIPESLWKLQDLLLLDISSNSFSGSISPQIGNLKSATYVDMSMNQFSDYLPNTFQELQSLIQFSLAHNDFQGPIPVSMGSMLNLGYLDLSYNNLSGAIPKFLEGLTQLVYFNVSFNELSGEIPTGGPFRNFTSQSFMHNNALCGLPKYQVLSCKVSTKKSKMNKVPRTKFLILGIAVFVFAIISALLIMGYKRKNQPPTIPDNPTHRIHTGVERVTYYELLQGTNEFGESNLLGRGSFGSVYKCSMGNGRIFAVKVFNMQVESDWKTFDAECEVLRNLRHRNLTKVISSCSNDDFKALVLEYMSNGSMENLLHSNEHILSIMQRLNMMIDVASALEYLHHGYSTHVVHCDLKPSNVLLDENMIAHVCDFGIAKLLGEGESISHTMTLATMGYMAPEYGLEGLVSTRGDVYSYGILLLETFTRKKPSDALFSGEFTLKQWVIDSQPNGFSGVIDNILIRPDEEYINEKMHSVSSILELALSCLANSPSERLNMVDVLAELKKIKNQFVTHTTHPRNQTSETRMQNSPAMGFEEISQTTPMILAAS